MGGRGEVGGKCGEEERRRRMGEEDGRVEGEGYSMNHGALSINRL